MLQTLIQIGKQVSQNRGEWDDLIDQIDVSKEQEKGMRLYAAEMLFDLDDNTIVFENNSVREYSESMLFDFKNIKIQGGNNKAIYACVYALKSLEQFRKTFFGIIDKDGKAPNKGQFTEAIEKDFGFLSGTLLADSLEKIFNLRNEFEERFVDSKTNTFALKPPQKRSHNDISVFQTLSLDKQDALILLVASVKSESLGINTPTYICNLDGYEQLIRAKFMSRGENMPLQKKLCYATGEWVEDVAEIGFNRGFNINKMFVTTTRNYASGFESTSFDLNYQASIEVQKLLERGSQYVLNNHTILIAGITHCILPQVFSQSTIDEKALLTKLSKRSELLFRSQEFKDLSIQIDNEDSDIYWIDFLGYESDGNYFKTINYIKDVSKSHFNSVLKAFQIIDRGLKNINGIAWENVMSIGKVKTRMFFNLNTFYNLIPLRKDKEKKNEALVIFKSILEQRKIDRQKLFEHYKDLILCHRYHRYKSYNNIFAPETINDKTVHFDFAVRNATYQYLAIFQVLSRLNLLKDMEETQNPESVATEKENETYQQKVESFFEKMSYTEAQKAMFYLGKALNSIAYAQVQAKHENKPILEKINYNGMDVKSILKLYVDLREKVKQYVKYETLKKVEPDLGRFDERFQPDSFKLSPEEALFFLFSGYSFRIQTDNKTDNQ